MLSSPAEVGELEAGDQMKLGLFPLTLSLSLGESICVSLSVCVCVLAECLFVALDGRGPDPGKKEALLTKSRRKAKRH